jgi:site-specific recombinase XerD
MKNSKEPIIKHIPRFFEYLDIEKGVSNKTQETYTRFLQNFIRWIEKNNLQELKPHELTDEHIWNYRVYLSSRITSKKEPIKKTTRNYYLIALRALLNYFADRDITSLPAEKVKLTKEDKERTVKFLDLNQIERLLLAPNTKNRTGLRDRAILESLFSTGLRVAELVNLDREQIKIKLETKILEVSIVGKGGHPRTVYFSERALRSLQKYLAVRRDKDKALFIRYKGPTESSKRMTSRSVENIVKKYSKKVGIPTMTTPHTLRHSYATDLLAQGVDLRMIQEFLGHRNIATTQIYTHITSQKLREVHQKFHSGREFKE